MVVGSWLSFYTGILCSPLCWLPQQKLHTIIGSRLLWDRSVVTVTCVCAHHHAEGKGAELWRIMTRFCCFQVIAAFRVILVQNGTPDLSWLSELSLVWRGVIPALLDMFWGVLWGLPFLLWISRGRLIANLNSHLSDSSDQVSSAPQSPCVSCTAS